MLRPQPLPLLAGAIAVAVAAWPRSLPTTDCTTVRCVVERVEAKAAPHTDLRSAADVVVGRIGPERADLFGLGLPLPDRTHWLVSGPLVAVHYSYETAELDRVEAGRREAYLADLPWPLVEWWSDIGSSADLEVSDDDYVIHTTVSADKELVLRIDKRTLRLVERTTYVADMRIEERFSDFVETDDTGDFARRCDYRASLSDSEELLAQDTEVIERLRLRRAPDR